jgi:isoquinoline 1-oxidoreductase subunit alpha
MFEKCHVQTHASQQAGSNLHSYSSALFYGGCTVKDGRIDQTNFDTYNSMRIGELPKVESIIMPSGGFWGGVGEPTICIAAPLCSTPIFAWGPNPSTTLRQSYCRNAQRAFRNFLLFDQFQFALPPDWNGIILARRVGIGPVGVRPLDNVSCPRKRLHAPAGEETMPNLNINGRKMSVDAAGDTPLLWAIREQLQMTGTKFGCGAGLCGACTVHVNGEAVRSCQTSLRDVAGKKITTIEGLSAKGDHPLQKAWIAEQVPQCGYCQSGQIMQAASLLAKNSNPTKEEVVAHMDGNLCRCMTYSRIQKAIMRAASEMRTASNAGTERRAT